MDALFLIHTFFTFFLTGLIWFVQLVHYPLFRSIPIENWVEFEKEHVKKATWITLPTMLVELLTGIALTFMTFQYIVDDVYFNSMIINLLLIICIWLSTFLIQVPIHMALSREPSISKVNKLIQSNWIRTAIWTIRTFLLLSLWLIQ
jgi:hypothetical protein